MEIFFQNSLSNNLEKFVPVDKNNVRMYVCGPTVYDSPHIGNARPMVIFDVLYRVLSKIYPNVTYVRNITDVDDKINKRANERGISIRELTDGVIEQYHKNLEELNVLPVTYEPRATDHIKEMIDLVSKLMENGYAYLADGHVLFRVRKDPEYGALSKRDLDSMIAGSRIEVAPYKEDPMDFVLWKPSEEGQPAWNSPFGVGRPGWHLECSAMSHKYLGSNFDIHAGGQDLIFPHHENEIAQNYGAFGERMANYWLHNGMLLVDGQKMSKSLGNVIKITDLLENLDGEIIRYVLLSTHYQKVLNWTNSGIEIAKQILDRLYTAIDGAVADYIPDEYEDNSILEALVNNLNTPLALKRLYTISDRIFTSDSEDEKAILRRILIEGANLLGILNKLPEQWFKNGVTDIDTIEALVTERALSKQSKDFAKADMIREKLLKLGVIIEDKKDGTSTWKKA